MALPKLDTPVYTLKLPSTQEEIKYRPFLVKEQKLLMMAQESGDEAAQMRTVSEIVRNCTFNKVDKPDKMATFDIEYMYRENRNNFLNRISTCYLTSVKVQYGGDRFTAYEETTSLRGSGAPPQRSQISLEFTELEILSQDHIKDGF